MTDIVERLKAWPSMIEAGYDVPAAATVMNEAAAEIERLRVENVALRQSALQHVKEANRHQARLAEAVEVMRSCRATYVENDDASALERIISNIDAFLAKLEGRTGD